MRQSRKCQLNHHFCGHKEGNNHEKTNLHIKQTSSYISYRRVCWSNQLVKIDLGYAGSDKDNYQQIAAVVESEFVDIDDIQIAGEDNQPTINENNRGENDEKQ